MAIKIICDRCGNETSAEIIKEGDPCHMGPKGPAPWPANHPARLPLLLSNGASKPGRDWKDTDLCTECLDELSTWMKRPPRTSARGRTA